MLSLESPLARIGPWLIIATLAVVAVATGIASDVGASSGRLGGDFPSFYAAGEIVIEGNGASLFDSVVQQAAQSDLLPDGRFLYFAYPPYTAAAYAAFAWMPFGLAFGVHTFVAILALLGALIAIRPLVRGYLDGPTRLGIAALACLATYPVIRSVLGGQNATFTLLGLALVARFDRDNRPLATGVAAAAMLYKPQFGLLVIAILMIGRRWRAALWTIPFAGLLFTVGVFVTGGSWVTIWLDAVSAFGGENLEVNGPLMISAWGWVQNLVGSSGSSTIVAAAIVVFTAGPFAFAILTRRWTEVPWYAAAPVILIAAPSALYYDATMTAVTVIAMLAWIRGVHWLVIATIIAVTWTQAAASTIGWSPLFIPILAAAAAFAVAAVRRPSPSNNP